jgi:hypothetical protein
VTTTEPPVGAAPAYTAGLLFELPDPEPPAGPRRVRVAGDLYHGRVPENALYVGRGAPGIPASRFANRHRAGACRTCRRHHSQADAVAAYAEDLHQRTDLIAAARRELAGRNLACWCRLTAGPCHGDVLLLVAAGAHPLAALKQVLP